MPTRARSYPRCIPGSLVPPRVRRLRWGFRFRCQPGRQSEAGPAPRSSQPLDPLPAKQEVSGGRRPAAAAKAGRPRPKRPFHCPEAAPQKVQVQNHRGLKTWVSQSTGRLFHSELPPETSRLSPKRHHPSHPRAAVGRVCAENLEKAPDLSSGLARSSPSRLPEGAPCEALAGLGWI